MRPEEPVTRSFTGESYGGSRGFRKAESEIWKAALLRSVSAGSLSYAGPPMGIRRVGDVPTKSAKLNWQFQTAYS